MSFRVEFPVACYVDNKRYFPSLINKIINSRNITEADKYFAYLPEEHRLLFYRDEKLSRIDFNPVGEAFNMAFINSQKGVFIAGKISYDEKSNFLFNAPLQSFDEMKIPEVTVIFNRIWQHNSLISEIRFGKSKASKKLKKFI